MKPLIRKLAARLVQMSPPTLAVIGLLYVLAVSAADVVCPAKMSFGVCYLLGVAFVAWRSGNRAATAVVSLAAVTALTIHESGDIGPVRTSVAVWNALARLGVFVATGWLIVEMTKLTRNLGRMVEERTAQWKAEAEQHRATSARLSDALERFEQLAGNITEVFWLSDFPNYRLSYLSPGYARIWGRDCAEVYRDPKAWLTALHPEDRKGISRRLLQDQARGGYDVEYRIIRPDGALRWIRDRAFPVRNLQGEVYRIAGIAEDITDRKQAELTREAFLSLGAKLSTARSPAEAARAIYATADLLWKWDCGALDVCVPDPTQVETVLSWDVVEGQRRALTPVDPIGPPTGRIRRVMSKGAELLLRKQGEPPDDDFAPIGDTSRLSASLMYAPMRQDGQPVGVLSIQSYTPNAYTPEDLRILQALADYCAGALERLRVEEVVRQREELNRAIVATAMDGYYALDFAGDAGGAIIDVNEAYCRMTGYSREELLRMRVNDLEANESPEEVARHSQRIMAAGGDRFETRHRRKDGQILHVEITASLLAGGDRRVFGFVRDITERKHAELAKEAFLSLGTKLEAARTPVEAARAAFGAADQLWKWDAAVLDLYSEEQDALEPVLFCDLVDGQRREVTSPHPKGAPPGSMLQILRDGPRLILRQTPEMHQTEFMPFGDTSRLSASLMHVPLRQEGQVVGVLSIQSYTPNAYTPEDLRTFQALADHCGGALERLRAEAALRESEEQMRAFYDSPGGLRGIVELLADDVQVLTTNASAALAYGRTVESMRQVRLTALGVARPVLDLWLDKLRESRNRDVPVSFEYSTDFRSPGGWALATVCPLHLTHPGARPRFAFLALDITERKRTETVLREEHDMLEQRVRERTAALQATNAALRESEAKYRLLSEALREAHDQLDLRVQERTAQLQEANRALSESEERYRSLVNNLNVGVYRNTPGPRGVFLQVNPALARTHGYDSVEEFLKVSVADLYQDPRERERFLADLQREGTLFNYELRLKKKDGTPIYGSVNATAHRGPKGELDWVDGVFEDITERKKVEQRLTEALELNSMLISASTVGIAAYKASGQCVVANEALARIAGSTVEELSRQDFRRLDSWRADGLLTKAQAALDTRLPQELECEGRTTFGRELVISARFTSFISHGELHLLFMVTDETQARRAQQALRASEERYRTLAESSPDAIFILDPDIRLQYVNSSAAALWRRAPADLIGLAQAELFAPETAEYHLEVVRSVFKTAKPVRREEPLAFPVGDQWIEIRLAPLCDDRGTVTSVMGICRDFTERKRAERKLAEALDLNQKMITASTLGIAAYKASGDCVFANEALVRTIGGKLREVVEDNFRQLEVWRKCGLLRLADEVLSQGRSWSGEVLCTTRLGETIWLDCHLTAFVSNGQPHLLLMALDITERKRTEEALKMQSLVLQNMAEGTLLAGPDQTILFANSALESMFGYEPGELNGKNVSVLNAWPVAETASFNAAVMRAIEGGRAWHGQYENRRKDGTAFTTESRVIKLTLSGQDHFISVQQDITERKRAEFLLRAQRDLGVSLSLAGDMPVALKRFLEIAVQLGGLDCGGVYLLNPATQGMDLAVHRGLSAAFVEAVAHYSEDGPQMRLLRRGRSLFTTYQKLPFPIDPPRQHEGLRALAFLPLSHNRRVIGALTLASHTAEEIPEQTRIVIEAISAQAAGAIARISAEAQRHRLERQILEISDREHARIGQDIHDGLCQHLVSLAFDANSLEHALSTRRRPEAKIARRIARFLDLAITESRQLSRGLFPVRLETEGLSPALEELAAATRSRFKIRCRFACKGPVAVANSTMATHLYRIAQEAVSNAIKHSRARSVAIRLDAVSGKLELSVEDNGMGLQPVKRRKTAGLGLHIMDYRARAIGAALRVGPGRRGGTIVSCCVSHTGK
jgi:PAS domain S-box-containing protein